MTRGINHRSARFVTFTLLTPAGLTACSDSGHDYPDARAIDAGSLSPDASAGDAGNMDSGTSVLLDAALASRFSPLIDNQGWRRFDAAADPLRSHQPSEINCLQSATFVEYGSFEIDTTRCNYVLSEHSNQRPIAAGTEVEFELLHYDLTAPQPAQAHLALLFGDELQWETTLPIPSPGDLVKGRFRATRALAVRDPIRLHLHNHGGNTYLIVSLEAAVSP